MNNTINNIINKGVPVDTPFLLSINKLRSFCDNQKKFEECINNAILKIGNFLSEIDLENYIYYSFAFQIIVDHDSLEKKIAFSPRTVPLTLIYSLIPKKDYSKYKDMLFNSCEDEVFDAVRNRINKLRNIKKKNNLSKEKVLAMEFPTLYKVYMENKKAIEYLILIEEKYNSGKISKNRYFELRNEFINTNIGMISTIYDVVDYYISTGVKKDYTVTKFCNDYADFFDKMIDSMDVFEEYFYNNPLLLDNIEIDKEKFELYLAIKNALAMKDADSKDKQRYVFYLANYFKEDANRQKSNTPVIQIEELQKLDELDELEGLKELDCSLDDGSISPEIVYKLYSKLLIKNPDIRPATFKDVDFSGMSFSDVEVFIEEYLETFRANWDIIPLADVGRKVFKNKIREKDDDLDRRIDLFMKKQSFYADLDPSMCIKGKKTFDGYIGYIFSNGIVVLDKFYQNSKKGIVSKGDAIYCMRMEDFYRLSQFPKSILRKDPNVISIEHRSGWEDKVLNIISQNGDTFKTKEEVNKLLTKRLITDNRGNNNE